MTIPWMMNCAHSTEGWCLECVVKLGNEHANLADAALVAEEALDAVLCAATHYFPDDMLQQVSKARAAIEQARKG